MEQGTATTTTTAVRDHARRPLPERLRTRWDELAASDRDWTFPFTLLAVGAILLLGAVVVPLSIPDPLPAPDPADVLAQQYLTAFAAPGSPTLAAKVDQPTAAEVARTYGTDGGDACSGSIADTWASVTTTGSSGVTMVDRAALARTKVAQSVYCPDRAEAFDAAVLRKVTQARAARAEAAAADTAT